MCSDLYDDTDLNWLGASFHVASCIKFDAFLDPKGTARKRTKTLKFNSDSTGIGEFLAALKQIENQFELTKKDFLILLKPTGGHYSYLVQQVLLNEGYDYIKWKIRLGGNSVRIISELLKRQTQWMKRLCLIWGGINNYTLICKELRY